MISDQPTQMPTIVRSPIEDIFIPFIFGYASNSPEYIQAEIDEQVNKLRILREQNSREYYAIVNSLKVLLLTPRIEDKVAFLLSIPSLAMGFGVEIEDANIIETDSPQVRNVKIAESIARKILSELGETLEEH